jgi:hypothetical protein
MTIRVNAKPVFLTALCVLGLAACAPEADGPSDADIARVGGPVAGGAVSAGAAEAQAEAISNCLDSIWEAQPEDERAFDRANDQIGGVSVSCAMSTTATKFVDALDALRAAAEAEDRAALLDALNIPFYYIDADGVTTQLTDADQINAAFDRIFDARVMGLLRRIDLAEVTVVPGEGAFLELGSLWLVADQNGGPPKIVTVNHQAMNEADAARARALETEPGE